MTKRRRVMSVDEVALALSTRLPPAPTAADILEQLRLLVDDGTLRITGRIEVDEDEGA